MSKSVWSSAIVIGLLALLFPLYQKNWFRITVTRDDFRVESNYTIPSIPTIYYPEGNLSSILPDWHNEGNAQFQLYRLMPGSNFELDFSVFEGGKNISTFKKISDAECHFPPSVLCMACIPRNRDAPISVNPADIVNDKQDGNEYYASFAKVEMALVEKLWGAMKLPPRILKGVHIEQAFASNLKKGAMSAPLHANAFTSSMAAQFVGKKTWIFFSPDVYRNSDMLNSYQTDSVPLVTQSPKKNYEVFVYTSQPGDVLFFTENWGHAVYTHAGPNVMINIRKFSARNIFRRPLDWIHTVLAMALSGRFLVRNQGKPLIPYLLNTQDRIQNSLCGDGDVAEWDKVMMGVINDAVQAASDPAGSK